MQQPPKVKVFVEGRYRKLTRDLPQTVFFCPECKGHPRRRKNCERCEGFGKLTRDSVQELIGWVLGKAFGTRKHKFHGAGREDVDVRMLGKGRPFILELLGPKTPDVDLAALEAEVNRRNEGRLEVEGLHWTEKARVRVIKETKHAKEYQALVAVEAEATPEAIATTISERRVIAQQTPSRVAHRRADKVRERWVEYRSIELQDDGRYKIRVACEHGTYVKEAISGEGGSTTPSLSDLLGVTCHCDELDVLDMLAEDGEAQEVRATSSNASSFGAGL